MHYHRTAIASAALDAKIASVALLVEECSQCIVGPVEPRVPDEDGCNWNLSKIHGAHCFECQQMISAAIAELRRQFTLVDAGGLEVRP